MLPDDIDNNDSLIVLFSSETCRHCKDIKPILAKIQEMYKVPIVESNEFIKYSVEFFPTVDIYKGGILVDRIAGKNSFDRYIKYYSLRKVPDVSSGAYLSPSEG